MKHLLFLPALIFLLAACAGKEFYEAEDTVGKYK